MAGIADFLDSLIGGFDLICFSLLIGGLIWGLFLLRPWQTYAIAPSSPESVGRTVINENVINATVKLIYQGGLWLVVTQLFKIVLKIWLMTAVLEQWPFPAFAETTQFIGGVIRALLTAVLTGYCYFVLRHKASSKSHWIVAGLLGLPMLVSGAWLVHAAGRFENQFQLMLLTVIHQIAAATWIGGVLQLLNVWRLRQQKQFTTELWPLFLQRFSTLGISAVLMILLSGIPIAWQYIDSWNGFIGTGYGNLLMVKIILLGLALGFALLNRSGVRNYFVFGNSDALLKRVPHYVEVEAALLIALLFTAASLASQPPANDIPSLTASWQEVVNAFEPRIPRTSSPTHQALLAGEPGRVAIVGQVPSAAATEWSDYNHNIAGIFLTVMSFLAMISYLKYFPPPISLLARYDRLTHFWPLGFVGLGVFLFFRSDAESWPLGPIGFWDSTFNNGEVLQHRIATLLVFVLGALEMRARTSKDQTSRLPYMFPVLAAFGGLMLLTHSHVGFQPKSAFLIQAGHTLMGVFALILACGRWLELNLDKPGKEIAGFVSVAALFQIGLILMFYREPLY